MKPTRRPWRSLAVLAAIVLSALGIAASLYSFHALVTRFYVTKENLVYVSTRAEVELARYASSLLGAVAAGAVGSGVAERAFLVRGEPSGRPRQVHWSCFGGQMHDRLHSRKACLASRSSPEW